MVNSQERSIQLEGRMLNFSLSVIDLTRKIERSRENDIVVGQLIRSSTSIGANYAEANNAASRLDFRNKIYIAKKEAAESKYWLKLLAGINKNINIEHLIGENTELILILQKIVSTLRNSKL